MRRGQQGFGAPETIAVLAAIVILSAVVALPKYKTEVVRPARPAGSVAPGEAGSGEGRPGVPGTTQTTAAGPECARGRNGGATETGVTGSTIKLGATVVDSGIGAAFLSDVRYGMLAVADRVNAAGGICGRRLQMVLKDDGWQADRGNQFLQDLVEGEKVFALAVVPSSEGLRVASHSGYLRKRGVPVVGTDGMLASQYTDPVIWPVAASTTTAVHVMAKDAFDRGRRNFAIVYDSNYHFGVEGAYAFNAAVRRLTGNDIAGYANPLTGSPGCSKRFCGIRAGQPGYQTELQEFNSACKTAPDCDYIVYLLEPETAQTWMAGGGIQASAAVDAGGPQPLFNRSFGVNCSEKCHGMWVWTGFVPPVEPFTGTPAVSEFVNALKATNAQADPNNSFVQGGYLGMKLLVEALRQTGPNLTRARLRETLDRMKLDTGLSKPLAWRPGAHFANQCLLGFSVQARPSFAGWRLQTPSFVCDPWPGQDTPPPDQQ